MIAEKSKKRRTPPKHLRTSNTRERRPARPKARQQSGSGPERRQAAAGRARQGAMHYPGSSTSGFYGRVLSLAQRSHEINQRRMHGGVAWLFALPVLLYVVRNLTDSSKIAFLLIWILGMFLIAAFLVMVAYQDDELQKNLEELQHYVPGEDTQLGKLWLVAPDSSRWMSESAEQLLRRANVLLQEAAEDEVTVDA